MPLYPHSILKKKKPSEVIGAPSVVKPRVNNNNDEPVAIKSKIESDSVDNPSLPGTVVSYSNENFSFKWELPACLFPSTKKEVQQTEVGAKYAILI